MRIGRGNLSTQKTCPSATLSITSRTYLYLGLKLATNRLSYGASHSSVRLPTEGVMYPEEMFKHSVPCRYLSVLSYIPDPLLLILVVSNFLFFQDYVSA
jgi:hypothetical protein